MSKRKKLGENMGNVSRTRNAVKNFIFSTLGNVLNYITSFVSRTVFIKTLGTTYLGVNGLFTNILGMLSLAELGVGIAISFSLYQPLAEKDTKKIQALINFYRTAYRFIALSVAILGVSLVPFLPYIVNEAEGVDNLSLIYLLYLTDTVLSYLITYKSTILNADQKSYLCTNITTITRVIATVFQILVLILFKNFIIYLIVQIVVQLLGKIYINIFTGKQYPYLQGRNKARLSKEERNTIFKKIKALMAHKVGDVAINQTDSIITSSFINVTVVGLVSNYTMIIQVINSVINTFFSSAVAGLGNVIATETKEKRLSIFKKYDFLGFFFFGWSSIFLYFLLEPFITLWIGADKLIDQYSLLLLCVNYYFTGQRVSLGNIKSAAGVFEQDVWMPFAQAAINIFTSILMVQLCGLPGIYIGTLFSSLVPNIGRPIIVYKYIFERSSKEYFIEYIKRVILVLSCGGIVFAASVLIPFESIILNLIMRFVLCLVVPFIGIWICYRKTSEWTYCVDITKRIINKVVIKHG